VAICSDVLVGRALENGTLVRAHDLSLAGYGYYVLHRRGLDRSPLIDTFLRWIMSAAKVLFVTLQFGAACLG